jgi:hypothetical protein
MTPNALQETVRIKRAASGPSALTRWLKSADSAWMQLARRRFLSCLVVTVLCLALRIALLKVDPKPQPQITDEFSYLFGAETLAKGRLATPTHPLWRFFETYHINSQPTTVSKYPPGQATFLALGTRLFGHPWYGVLISVALMCGSICWMLQGWVPVKYALAGAVLAVLQFGSTHYWMDSYWGGAVAGIGGALVFGSIPRLARNGRASTACIAAIGIAILANSRPFEGLVLILLSTASLIWWTRGRFSVWLRPSVVLPCAIILLATAGAMAYYNVKTTGSPTTFPYTLNQNRYAVTPLFWIMPPFAPAHLEYRDPSMRELWEKWDADHYTSARHNPVYAAFRLYSGVRDLIGSGAGLVVMFLCVCALPLERLTRPRTAFVVIILFFCALLMDKFGFAHYMAPAVGAIFVLAMFGLRLLGSYRIGIRSTGRALMLCFLSAAGVLFVLDTVNTAYNRAVIPLTGVVPFRREVAARLASESGMHLVLVHYSPNHDPHAEMIFNSPDIDAQKIVWAFDFGPDADRPLLNYYRGRKVWLARPDGPNPTVEPYLGN